MISKHSPRHHFPGSLYSKINPLKFSIEKYTLEERTSYHSTVKKALKYK